MWVVVVSKKDRRGIEEGAILGRCGERVMAVVEKPTGQKSAGLTLRARWLLGCNDIATHGTKEKNGVILVAIISQHTEQKNGVLGLQRCCSLREKMALKKKNGVYILNGKKKGCPMGTPFAGGDAGL